MPHGTDEGSPCDLGEEVGEKGLSRGEAMRSAPKGKQGPAGQDCCHSQWC